MPVKVNLVADFFPLNILLGISAVLLECLGFEIQYAPDRDEDLTNYNYKLQKVSWFAIAKQLIPSDLRQKCLRYFCKLISKSFIKQSR